MMLGRLLDIFSGASGGTMMRVLVGSGEGALDRVLLETSSHYLLGVEPTDADRGRLRELRVKVTNTPNVTVRSRLWVAVPKDRVRRRQRSGVPRFSRSGPNLGTAETPALLRARARAAEAARG